MKRAREGPGVIPFVLSRVQAVRFGDEGEETDAIPTKAPSRELVKIIHARIASCTSPFLWFPPHASFKWKDAIAQPTEVCLAFKDEPWATLLTVENLGSIVENVVERQCRQKGDTLIEWKRYSISFRVREALTKAGYQYKEGDSSLVDGMLDKAMRIGLSFVTDGEPVKTYLTPQKRQRQALCVAQYICRKSLGKLPHGRQCDFSHASLDTEELSTDQKLAGSRILRHLHRHHVAILVGAGGSGKTHLISHLANALSGDTEGSTPTVIAFLAPTNKAASVLTQKVGPLQGRIFGTIHSVTRSLAEQENMVVVFLIIDEASMLSDDHIAMIAKCPPFAAAALLLVGDDLQLPPVAPGEVLRDMMENYTAVRLETNHRAKGDLNDVLQNIRKGDVDISSSQLCFVKDEKTRHSAIQTWAPTLTISIRNREKAGYNIYRVLQTNVDPQRLRYDDFRKENPHSTYLRSFVPFPRMPVVVTSNNYKAMGACRGRTGVIQSASYRRHVAQITLKLDCMETEYEPSMGVQLQGPFWELWRDITVGYAITVHSAQSLGSERVAVLLPPSSSCPLLTLEMLYTALSRASSTFMIFAHSSEMWTECKKLFSRRSKKRVTLLSLLLRQYGRSRPQELQ